MAHYLVRAQPRRDRLDDLREQLDAGDVEELNPFGTTLYRALDGARFDSEAEEAVWEEEDYCSPPLAMERDAVLDDHFDDIRTERVSEEEGWQRIEDLPSLWVALGIEEEN